MFDIPSKLRNPFAMLFPPARKLRRLCDSRGFVHFGMTLNQPI